MIVSACSLRKYWVGQYSLRRWVLYKRELPPGVRWKLLLHTSGLHVAEIKLVPVVSFTRPGVTFSSKGHPVFSVSKRVPDIVRASTELQGRHRIRALIGTDPEMAFSSNGAVSTPTNPGNMSLMSPGDFLRKSGGQEQLSGTPRPSAAAAKGRRRAMGFPSTAGSAPRSGGLAPTWDTQLRQALRPVGPEESLEDLRRAMADLARRLQAAEAREQARAGPGGTGNTTAEGIASSEDVSSDEDEPGTGERAPDPDPEQFSVPSRRDGQRRGETAEDLGGAGEPTGRREPDQRRERHGVVGQHYLKMSEALKLI
ncbi:uncharacterized protein LOC143840820 [Paroedura picta]|uniref:uncharacterized protein LOC143840820 n=1 Tax=Paroedura picta TaxID=143630 RepID=UPI004055C097